MKTYKSVGGLSDRIQEIVLRSGLEITVIAKRLHISRSLLYGYMYYDIMPSVVNLMKIASEFNVSADWLLGLTEDTEIVEVPWISKEIERRNKQIDIKAMQESIRSLRGEVSRAEFAKVIGVDEKCIYNWENGRTVPTRRNQEALTDLGWPGLAMKECG